MQTKIHTLKRDFLADFLAGYILQLSIEMVT